MSSPRAIAGEYEPPLTAWVDGLGAPGPPAWVDRPIVHLQRGTFELPARELLPGLERYARLAVGGEERLVGYVEASHGCVHRCRHCPVPAVYEGASASCRPKRSYATSSAWRRWARATSPSATPTSSTAGATPWESYALHEPVPQLSFDCTTKIEHVLEHAGVWTEMAAAGCRFVVCALESVNDEILERIAKGHTTAEAIPAIELLREHGIETRPSFMPFTPWTTPRDVLEIVDFVAAHDLVANFWSGSVKSGRGRLGWAR